ncbi:MAG: NUDIX hydrolase [Gemmataceae bacterium]|nr:NUDIX hydrolase [Gemmataceae bacterium]
MGRTIVHTGRKIKVAIDEEDGVRRDVVLHPGAVAILPMLDVATVVLVRNERPVVGETLWEIPAGTLEPPEPPEEAARRELAEETGYSAERWTRMGEFFPSPGVLSERTHVWLAEGLVAGEQRLEADERMTVHAVPLAQALAWTRDGTIRDAKTLVALLWRAGLP